MARTPHDHGVAAFLAAVPDDVPAPAPAAHAAPPRAASPRAAVTPPRPAPAPVAPPAPNGAPVLTAPVNGVPVVVVPPHAARGVRGLGGPARAPRAAPAPEAPRAVAAPRVITGAALPAAIVNATPPFPFEASHVAPGKLARFAYCAFGSNLNHRQMAWRCPSARVLLPGTLFDFRLLFRRVADVVFTPGEQLPVGLYRVTAECVKELDRYEGFPRTYQRRFVLVHTDAGPVWSFIYTMRERPIEPPSDQYLDTIRRGYADFDLAPAALNRAVTHAKNAGRPVATTAPRISRGVMT